MMTAGARRFTMSYRKFYEGHIERLKKNDVNLLVESDYHDDAVMILLAQDEPQVIRGKDALKQLLEGYLEFIYRGYVSTEKYSEIEDSLFFEATIRTASGTAQVYDALLMKEGKILRHYSGVKGLVRDRLRVNRIDKEGGVTLHTLSSPEDGELVNAVIVETARVLIVIDTLHLVPYARELREYADSLGKPIDRVLVTHGHPDHWFGLEFFQDVPTFAFPETRAEIEGKGDYLLGYHRSLHGKAAADLIPAGKTVPSGALEEGALEVDGLTLTLTKVRNAESNIMLAVELPAQRTFIAQDLIYSGAYLFVGEKTSGGDTCFDGWIEALHAFREKGFETVIPGHGEVGGASLIDENIEYLENVKGMFAAAADGPDLKARIKARYPDRRVPLMLVMSNYFLYDMAEPQEQGD